MAKKKTGKAVQVKSVIKSNLPQSNTDQALNDDFKEFWSRIKTERQHYTPSEAQLDVMLGELLDTIDQHFIESAFNFRTNLNGTQGNWSEHPFLEGFVDKLKPYARRIEKRLRGALPDYYPGSMVHEPDAELTSMICEIEECAYAIGVFMGAKLAGASQERMNLLRKHVVL